MKKRFYKIMTSPVGQLRLVAEDDALISVLWGNARFNRGQFGIAEGSDKYPVLMEAERQLREYFSGQRETFELPIKFMGTKFQQKVWTALCKIPFGKTRTYAEVAQKIGSPKSYRAVGASNGKNPLAIVVPCHRVIGKNGSLTGFAGGLEVKARLLKLEGARSITA